MTILHSNINYNKFGRLKKQAGVAQLVEQLICNQPVGGSSPFTSSISSQNRTLSGEFGTFH
jgi:hypothetical protein